MKWSAQLNEAIQNLFSAKLRSLLALLGILVGTASVVAMVSGGKLATNEALKQFKALGTDLLAVSISDNNSAASSATQANTNLSLADVDALPQKIPSILAVAPYTQLYNPMQFAGHTVNGMVLGVTERFADIIHINMLSGRFISNLDGYGFFCVLGNKIYEDIKKYTLSDPIGQQIQIDKNIFTIAGVAAPWPENSFVYANVDYAVMIPLMSSTLLSKYATISNIIMRLTPEASGDAVTTAAQDYLQSIQPNKHFYFRSAKELVARMAKQNEILTVFLGLIGGISLLVGGIGVMNIMLVSVIERRREIGIRLAIGATRANIRSLFLIEAVVLSVLGGSLGVIIGILIAYIIAFFWHWEFTFFLLPPLIGFSISAATGIFFGIYPAHKAAQLDPIQALRMD